MPASAVTQGSLFSSVSDVLGNSLRLVFDRSWAAGDYGRLQSLTL